MRNITPLVKQLIIINVIFFFGSELVPQAKELFAMFYVENTHFEFWQPISSMFMHGGFMHILFNMYALFAFGSALEHIWGAKRFLIFYFVCGIGAAVLHQAVGYYQFHQVFDQLTANGFSATEIMGVLNSEVGRYDTRWMEVISQNQLSQMLSTYHAPAVGASGAIYGLLVAFAFMYPNAGLMLLFFPMPIKAKYFVPGLLLLDLYLGTSGGGSIFGGSTGIAHFAHIGGAVAGFLMMLYYKKTAFNRYRWDR